MMINRPIPPLSRRLSALLLTAACALVLMSSPRSGLAAPASPAASDPQARPIVVALDAEFGHPSSTSDDSIRMGMLTAIDEINSAGGLLGGRKLKLVQSDNRAVPARGKANFRKHAENPELVAVFTSKFSPVALEQAKIAEELKLLLLDPWAAADPIISPDPAGTHTFRLSLRDSWAIPAMMNHLKSRGIDKVGVLLPTSGWGRSNENSVKRHSEAGLKPQVVQIEWYNWGTKSMLAPYFKLLRAGAQAVLLVANEVEGSILVREIAGLQTENQLPVVSHWGVSGGNFVQMLGADLGRVDFSVVQTFTFVGRDDVKARSVLARAGKLFGIKSSSDLPSHVGFAHAYDLTHILARAIALARSAERPAIRDALEQVRSYEGLTGNYPEPFNSKRHEAMSPSQVFIGQFLPSGEIERLSR